MYSKVYIFSGMATFICPQCNRYKTIHIEPGYMQVNKTIKVRCSCKCGHSFIAILERRRCHRKELTLPGIFSRIVSKSELEKGFMVVKEISRSGIKIMPHGRPVFNLGDEIRVVFNLNDKNKSLIKKNASIMNISRGSYLGMEFNKEEIFGPISKFIFG